MAFSILSRRRHYQKCGVCAALSIPLCGALSIGKYQNKQPSKQTCGHIIYLVADVLFFNLRRYPLRASIPVAKVSTEGPILAPDLRSEPPQSCAQFSKHSLKQKDAHRASFKTVSPHPEPIRSVPAAQRVLRPPPCGMLRSPHRAPVSVLHISVHSDQPAQA